MLFTFNSCHKTQILASFTNASLYIVENLRNHHKTHRISQTKLFEIKELYQRMVRVAISLPNQSKLSIQSKLLAFIYKIKK